MVGLFVGKNPGPGSNVAEFVRADIAEDRIRELEAAIGNALDLINADFFDEAGASLRAALGKERSDALPTL